MIERNSLRGPAVAVVLLFAVAGPAHAYLDPVTGVFIAQGIGAIVLGAIASIKRLRTRVLGFFRRGKAPADESTPGQ